MTRTLLVPCSLVLAAALLGACTRTDDGFRIETEEAGDQAEAAAAEAAETLDRAGAAAERGMERLEREAGPVLDDASITAKVKAKLAADPEANAFGIDVDTTNRVVTLRGKVRSDAISEEAHKLARNTSGVRAVVNRLVVEDPAPAPGAEP